MKKTILMILNLGFPDVRVCQEAEALSIEGYEVWIVVSSLKTRSPEYSAEAFNTIILDADDYEKRRFLDSLAAIFYHYPHLEKKLLSLPEFKKIKSSIIAVHVHDLHWCRFGLNIAAQLGVRCFVDFHENSPALPEYFGHRILSRNPKKLIMNITRSRAFIQRYERWVVKKADAIVTVAKENEHRLIGRYGAGRYYCVSNTKDPKRYRYLGPAYGDRMTLLYHGTIQSKRGIRLLARAFSLVDTTRLKLVILGFNRNSQEKTVVSRILSLLPAESYELLDWTSDIRQIQLVIESADVGIIPHERCELTETTLPNKLFEYFCYGKPVIVSDVAPLKRVVNQTGSGLVFKAGDARDLARCFEELGSAHILKQLSTNARQAAEGAFGWSRDRAELVRMYSEIL